MPILPFDDSPYPVYKKILSGGIDTSTFDQFRQGVDLLSNVDRIQTIFFQIGPEVDSSVNKQSNFGLVKGLQLPEFLPFQDNEKFSSKALVEGTISQLTFPLAIGDQLSFTSSQSDGSLDVFNIRRQIAGFDIEFPFPSYGIKADFGNGNKNAIRKSDQVEQRILFNMLRTNNQFFLDTDFQNLMENSNFPFDDTTPGIIHRNILSDSHMDSVITNQLYNLNPSTDNFEIRNYSSSGAGFVFDNINSQGTDSIAFGGFQYK